MCLLDIDKTGFPLVALEEWETYFHFFPITRVQLEEAVAAGWLVEDKYLCGDRQAVMDMIHRGEVCFPGFQETGMDTPEHALPIEVLLFPGGHGALSRLARNGLRQIDAADIYSFYLTNLKQREFMSLIRWLQGDRFSGDMMTVEMHGRHYYKFLQYPVSQLIEKILELEGLNPRARVMLELFAKYKGMTIGLPGNIFEMTGNYMPRDSREIALFTGSEDEPLPGTDTDGYPLYYPVIVGKSQLWPHISVPGKVRHLKVEFHPLVGSRGVYKRRAA